MTETSLHVPNIQDAANKIRDQIRAAFVELLTPEQWQAMIQMELEAFLKPRRNNYDGSTRPSVFHDVCQAAFRELVQERLKETLNGEAFKASWDGKVSDLVKEWLTENQEQLIQSTILQLAGMAAQNVLSSMGR